MYGRIRSIEAPVVPIIFEITAPNSRNTALTNGVAFLFTLTNIPPAATNNEPNNAMNERYSARE